MVVEACNLVSTEWLARQLAQPDLRVYDCTMLQTPDPKSTYRVSNLRDVWAAGHIPGAGYIDLIEDFSDPRSQLRFMLSPPQDIAGAMARLGIGNDARVVLYSTANMSWATRAWWVMKSVGFERVAVLDGGLPKWRHEGQSLSIEPCRYPPVPFSARFRPELICDRHDVLAAISDGKRVIVDALTAEQFAGTGGPQYGRPGHIAGAVNIPWRDLTDAATGTFKPVHELRRIFVQAGVTPEREALVYCGAGIAASAVFFALTLARYQHVRLYDASLQEWAADASLPMQHD